MYSPSVVDLSSREAWWKLTVLTVVIQWSSKKFRCIIQMCSIIEFNKTLYFNMICALNILYKQYWYELFVNITFYEQIAPPLPLTQWPSHVPSIEHIIQCGLFELSFPIQKSDRWFLNSMRWTQRRVLHFFTYYRIHVGTIRNHFWILWYNYVWKKNKRSNPYFQLGSEIYFNCNNSNSSCGVEAMTLKIQLMNRMEINSQPWYPAVL